MFDLDQSRPGFFLHKSTRGRIGASCHELSDDAETTHRGCRFAFDDAGSVGRRAASRRASAYPGELARAVYHCLECFDRAVCDEMSTQDRRLSEAPGFCSNGGWISALMASSKTAVRCTHLRDWGGP